MSVNMRSYTRKMTLPGIENTALLQLQESLSTQDNQWFFRRLQRNQRVCRFWPIIIKKSRWQIKIVLLQLSDQMVLNRNYLISFSELPARISANLTWVSFIQNSTT